MILTAAVEDASQVPSLWTWIGGPAVGVAVATGVMTIMRAYMEKKIAPHDDLEQKTVQIIKGLESVVTVLKEELSTALNRIKDLQDRIDSIESNSVREYNYKLQLHKEISDLQIENNKKNQRIQHLEHEIEKVRNLKFNELHDRES